MFFCFVLFCPLGENYFLNRVDLFSEEARCVGNHTQKMLFCANVNVVTSKFCDPPTLVTHHLHPTFKNG